MTKERRLGRGLAALLGDPVATGADAAAPSGMVGPRLFQPSEQSAEESAGASQDEQLLMLDVGQIQENPFQPRRDFSEEEIASLAESLKEHDMLQPVLVRPMDGGWQLISGERRLRAAMRAGWTKIPARVREADDRLVAELAIVENLQRKDLSPLEKALSFRRYLEQHECPQEELARRLKIDRSTIANLMRLLELPEQVQTDLTRGEITAGHARALLPLGDADEQIQFSRRIQVEGLSVRAVEKLVQEMIQDEDADPVAQAAHRRRSQRSQKRNSHLTLLEERLRVSLGTKVEIRANARGRGQLVLHFTGNEEFERLQQLLLLSGGRAAA
ncbi:MAG: ParB/RepB/Spo0J family partition protein [Planctomycetota bacterium]|nr:ParB/RepB/Spo0J family partition protein [Planctomycetota bacterium]MDA1179754.1 ParB/RepB/Spo0J family partition protein [Planctomycetota bacterium]